MIGTAGTTAKAARLVHDFGFDRAFVHDQAGPGAALQRAFPSGIDVVVDRIGGPWLEAALDAVADHGGVVLAGIASEYDGRPTHQFGSLYMVVRKRLLMRGFVVLDHLNRMPEFRAEVRPMAVGGQLNTQQSWVSRGIESFPDAISTFLSRGSKANGRQ